MNNFFDIFKIWQGGMSFHGGLIGIIIASILFSKKNNHNPYKYLDIISIVAPVGIFFGRFANFFYTYPFFCITPVRIFFIISKPFIPGINCIC